MNTSQSAERNPQWNYQWSHMALPTFGFIFAVPEPPPDLQLPAHHRPAIDAPPFKVATSVESRSDVDECTPKSETPEQSL
jgi:hypothetical protein